MCEICEWGNDMTVDIDALVEKWNDALECAEDWTERNLVSEFLEDLKDLRK